jgi:hypothetical protein
MFHSDKFGRFHGRGGGKFANDGGGNSFRQTTALEYPLLQKITLSKDQASINVNQAIIKNVMVDLDNPEMDDVTTVAYVQKMFHTLNNSMINNTAKLRHYMENECAMLRGNEEKLRNELKKFSFDSVEQAKNDFELRHNTKLHNELLQERNQMMIEIHKLRSGIIDHLENRVKDTNVSLLRIEGRINALQSQLESILQKLNR